MRHCVIVTPTRIPKAYYSQSIFCSTFYRVMFVGLYFGVLLVFLLTSWSAVAEESACGSSSVAFSTYVAGMVAGKHLPVFESCCEIHDLCYDSCASRDQCDQDFGTCMKNGCAKSPSQTYEECVNTSGMFLSAVETFGSYAYSENCTNDLGSSVQFVFDFLEVSSAEIINMLS